MTRTQLGRARRGRGIFSAAVILLVVVGVAIGCGTPPPPTASPAAASAAPGSPDASATPRPTAWPGNAVLGINALGVADGQILEAINDFNSGIATEDLALIRKAADGLAGLEVLLPNITRIDIFEPMRSFADRYSTAIRSIASAATAVRTAIDAHDAAAITSSSQALVASLSLYTAVQPELAAWVQQATEQQRLLTK
jgi:hypothetical protein